ncbi:hypothetical protein OROGR_026553 [Orobanche gracilis]
MHCTAKSNTAHNFVDKLKEGIIYYINDFTVLSNKEDYRIMKDSAYMIEFDGATSMRRSSVKPDGFVRHPFDLIDFDNLQPTNNKFLIDVVGYVTNVGRSIQQRTGSRTLDFSWPIKALQHVVEVNKEALLANQSEAKAGTLENLLMWARNRKNGSATFICEVKINNIGTRKGWNYPSCGRDKCKKGLTRKECKFWCEACNKPVAYPVVRCPNFLRKLNGICSNAPHLMSIVIEESGTEITCAEDKEPKYAEDAEPTDQKKKKKSSLCKTRTLTNQLRSQILEAVALLNGIIVSVFNE